MSKLESAKNSMTCTIIASGGIHFYGKRFLVHRGSRYPVCTDTSALFSSHLVRLAAARNHARQILGSLVWIANHSFQSKEYAEKRFGRSTSSLIREAEFA